MIFTRWSFYQFIMILLLTILAFFIDSFKEDVAISVNASNVDAFILMLERITFLIIIIGLFSFILYFQTKKSDTFLTHSLWDKMPVILTIILLLSFIGIFVVFLSDPLNQLFQSQRWLMYCILYYFLFVFHMLVLSIIHKTRKQAKNQVKIQSSFLFTVLILVLGIFLI
ncbi:hypothetical protein SAMN05421676_105129 [Salinibacillus kushneri]|uniref:Uncharacterized protein n=1 Tax=Salinibacillus kushneri TaxID=237682 RepID=A0A1I0EYL5_9BACI|nr:hypothetical protein [Salinibacillus kushneri]SET50608.1 hypothetical protein SAMN05421676_105129 [Salinibacillus kushneri]